VSAPHLRRSRQKPRAGLPRYTIRLARYLTKAKCRDPSLGGLRWRAGLRCLRMTGSSGAEAHFRVVGLLRDAGSVCDHAAPGSEKINLDVRRNKSVGCLNDGGNRRQPKRTRSKAKCKTLQLAKMLASRQDSCQEVKDSSRLFPVETNPAFPALCTVMQ